VLQANAIDPTKNKPEAKPPAPRLLRKRKKPIVFSGDEDDDEADFQDNADYESQIAALKARLAKETKEKHIAEADATKSAAALTERPIVYLPRDPVTPCEDAGTEKQPAPLPLQPSAGIGGAAGAGGTSLNFGNGVSVGNGTQQLQSLLLHNSNANVEAGRGQDLSPSLFNYSNAPRMEASDMSRFKVCSCPCFAQPSS